MGDIFTTNQRVGNVAQNSGILAGNATGNTINNYHSSVSSDETELRHRKEARIRETILLSDPTIDRKEIRDKKGRRTPHTCEWIRNNELYQEWKDQGPSTCLWISGSFGRGKTMLSVFLTEELEAGRADVCFFFCDHQDAKRNTATGILRGLIYQLLCRNPSLAQHFEDEREIEDDDDTPRVLYYQESEFRKWLHLVMNSASSLWNIFIKMVEDSRTNPLFCILDGLDECPEDSKRFITKKISELASQNPATASQHLRLIVVSRDVSGLQQLPRIRLDPDHNADISSDIELYISHEMENHPLFRKDISTCKKIERILRDRAEGTFLWLSYALEEIRHKQTPNEMLLALQKIPQGLFAVYDRIIRHIPSDQVEICSRILSWTVFSTRPLNLKELATILRVTALDQISEEVLIRSEIQKCSPLLIVNDGRIELTHQSVRDYLTRATVNEDPKIESFRFSSEDTNCTLAKECLKYLEQIPQLKAKPLYKWHCHAKSSEGVFGNKSGLEAKYPFLNYAAENWPVHARLSASRSVEILEWGPHLFAGRVPVINSYRYDDDYLRNYSQSFGTDFTAFTLAIYWNILEWVRYLLSSRSKRITGYDSIKDVLLPGRKPIGLLELEMAITLPGHSKILELLLDNGYNANSDTVSAIPAIELAAKQRHHTSVQVFQILVDRGALDKICLKSKRSNYRVFRMIVHKTLPRPQTADIMFDYLLTKINDIPWDIIQPSLSRLVALGPPRLLESIVISKGFTAAKVKGRVGWVNHESPHYAETLAFCINHGFEVNVRVMRRIFVSPSAWRWGRRTTALIEACESGKIEAVQKLISIGAQIDIICHESDANVFVTEKLTMKLQILALLAFLKVSPTILQLLISHGANLNDNLLASISVVTKRSWYNSEAFRSDEKLRTDCLRQVQQRSPEAIKMLLELGARSIQALFLAMEYGHIGCLKLLLDHGHSWKESIILDREERPYSLAEWGLRHDQLEAVEWLDAYIANQKRPSVHEVVELENSTVRFGLSHLKSLIKEW